MMNNKTYLALAMASAMALTGCNDGKDGSDGADGGNLVNRTDVTGINVMHYAIEDGQVTIEFEVTNGQGYLVGGLDKAEVKFAANTDKGIVLNRDGELGGYGTFEQNAEEPVDGASLQMDEDGLYTFTYPMPAVEANDEGILWLRVGGGEADIARSQPLVVAKPEAVHTTATENCFSCHVDYATGSLRHASYTAIDTDGEVDFVAGCLVCHNNVSRADEQGGYATNTLQKIGHINHLSFEKDYTSANCFTCHAEPVYLDGNNDTCRECHAVAMVEPSYDVMSDEQIDYREAHGAYSAVSDRATLRAKYVTETSAVYWDPDFSMEHDNTIHVGGYCTDVSLFDVTGETPEKADLYAMYKGNVEGVELAYLGAYIHGYHNNSIVGRPSPHGVSDSQQAADGLSVAYCHPYLAEGFAQADLMASSRVTFKDRKWESDDNKFGVSFTSYSDVVTLVDTDVLVPAGEYERRLAVTADSCTTCHNNETNYHKSGSYNDGGESCVACHNNGQDRSAKNTAPGFGPMVHSWHWGEGNTVTGGTDEEGNPIHNAAASLNADNCVACHDTSLSLSAIPNMYIRAKAYHDGDDTKMASPITANCFACHNSDAALGHMERNGGTISAEKGKGDDGNWFTQSTAESCATCHDMGKSHGIDKYHVFER
ncbi:multiheme c-type cytochrome [Ferrimonas marina]|nr:hypothetical protein [Ferrimonas marina]